MTFRVVDEDGKILGYIIGEYFVSVEALKLVTNGTISIDGDTVGKLVGKKVRIFGVLYNRIDAELTHHNYASLLSDLRYSKVLPNDFIYIPISRKEISTENISKYWVLIKTQKSKCKEYIYEIYSTHLHTFVAYMSTSKNIYCENDITVNMFEVTNKNIGLGTKIIKNLLESDYSISGLSVYSAKNFWEKLGAEFEDNLYHFSLKS